MSTQLDLLSPTLDDATSRRLGLQATREVKRPRMLQPVARPENSRAKSCALVDVPRAANADPDTSHESAAAIKSSGALKVQQALAIEYTHKFPGYTSAELAHEYAKVKGGTWREYRQMFGRRLPEVAVDVLHVKRGEPRTCRMANRNAITWWPL